MSEFHPNRVRPMRPRFTVRRLINFWPLLVWIGVLGMAYWAYQKGVHFTRMNGLVDPITEAVAADEDARIKEILVTTGTPVKKGDKLVILDTAIIEAQIDKLTAGIRADLEDSLLSYELDLARLKNEQRNVLRDKLADEGELAAVNDQLESLRPNKAIPGVAETLYRAERDAGRLQSLIGKDGEKGVYDKQLEEIGDEIKPLEEKVNALREGLKNPDWEKLASANGDLSELQELKVLKDRSILYSSHDGNVDRIERDDGEFILKGDTILRVTAHPKHIRVLLPNDQLGTVKVGDPVWVSSITDKYKYFKTKIINTSPRVTNAPNTTSPLPNQVLHGQEIIAAFPPESGFLPGQPVILHTEEPGQVPFLTRLFGGRGRAEQ